MKKVALFCILLLAGSQVFAEDSFATGVSNFQRGNYNAAALNLKNAVAQNPKSLNARYYLAQTYIMQKNLSGAREQYNYIIQTAPETQPVTRLAQSGLQKLAAATPVYSTSSSTSGSGDNYLNNLMGAKTWQHFPVSVYVPNTPDAAVVKAAFAEWERTTGFVRFIYIADPAKAQITVLFMPALETTSSETAMVGGLSKPYFSGNYLIKSEIKLLTGPKMDSSKLFYAALHEMGHSLGLSGHSTQTSDVMASSVSDDTLKRTPSARDVNTLRILYNGARPDNSTAMTDSNLAQALDYARQYQDKAIAWANLGGVYYNKKMYSEAIKNYQRAAQIEPQNADFSNLLAQAYLANGDVQPAFVAYKHACDCAPNNDFYNYSFAEFCLKNNFKQTGAEYLKKYLSLNPRALSDEKFKSLIYRYNN